ncbi:TetR family transcriptional regulator [Paraburkholderia sediminicola]|uniref:TetR family transcriptional regulator n=1 Tax=Paraburkholderia metrosideri TaxID=580937 RepID=A0ABW9E6F9_9BURK
MTDSTRSTPASGRNASDTRERILEAARACFSRRSYENVGLREIASEAGVDAALVSRYFGGKEGLFAQVVEGAFHVEEHLPESLDTVGEFLVAEVMAESNVTGEFNPLRLLLLGATSPDTAEMVSARFHAEFVQPLARKLKGRDAEIRAALIGSYVIGLATMRHMLESPTLTSASSRKVAAFVAAAIQTCVGISD